MISEDINNYSDVLKGAGLPEFIYPKMETIKIKVKELIRNILRTITKTAYTLWVSGFILGELKKFFSI
ncbi:MAG: hypothetical protein IPJ20_18225 [Flammeovirgaceae bacterium]|nr:hypothetical protein [Flammeovirgaceae bacterium]